MFGPVRGEGPDHQGGAGSRREPDQDGNRFPVEKSSLGFDRNCENCARHHRGGGHGRQELEFHAVVTCTKIECRLLGHQYLIMIIFSLAIVNRSAEDRRQKKNWHQVHGFAARPHKLSEPNQAEKICGHWLPGEAGTGGMFTRAPINIPAAHIRKLAATAARDEFPASSSFRLWRNGPRCRDRGNRRG